MPVLSIPVLDATNTQQTVATNDAIVANIGEVQTSPTSNTMQDRLKTLHADLTSILAQSPTTWDTNSGNKGASTQRIVLATDQPTMSNAQPVTVSGPVNVIAAITGGATPYSYLAAASANQDSTVIKGSAGNLKSLIVLNVVSALRYVKIYDKASGPTSGDTPVLRFAVPHNTGNGAGWTLPIPPEGIAFAAGISFRMTTGIADNDTNAVTANDLVLSAAYK